MRTVDCLESVIEHVPFEVALKTDGRSITFETNGGYETISKYDGRIEHRQLEDSSSPLINDFSKFFKRMLKKYNFGGCPICGSLKMQKNGGAK